MSISKNYHTLVNTYYNLRIPNNIITYNVTI